MFTAMSQTQYKVFLRLMAQKGKLDHEEVEEIIDIITIKEIRFKDLTPDEFSRLVKECDNRSTSSRGDNLLFASEVQKRVVDLDRTLAQHDMMDGFVLIGNYADGRANEPIIMMAYAMLVNISY